MSSPSIVGALIRGAVAGAAATWLMDVATTAVQKLQPAADAQREGAAWRNGQTSVANLVDLIADRLRMRLDQSSKAAAAGAIHYALGADASTLIQGVANLVRSRLTVDVMRRAIFVHPALPEVVQAAFAELPADVGAHHEHGIARA